MLTLVKRISREQWQVQRWSICNFVLSILDNTCHFTRARGTSILSSLSKNKSPHSLSCTSALATEVWICEVSLATRSTSWACDIDTKLHFKSSHITERGDGQHDKDTTRGSSHTADEGNGSRSFTQVGSGYGSRSRSRSGVNPADNGPIFLAHVVTRIFTMTTLKIKLLWAHTMGSTLHWVRICYHTSFW